MASKALPGDLQKSSGMRKVALGRLEKELRKAIDSGRGVPEEIERMAGLVRLQYIFVYPEENEIVVAGPAEGWMNDSSGRCIGLESGSPTLLLEDLATAMRAFPPGQLSDTTLSCSIDPTQEGLANLQGFLKRIGRINPTVDPNSIVLGMKQSLGHQRVSITGISPESHFAQVMVEADYRMKLIGIGLEPSPVKMSSWIELASASSVAANALQRWYFVPDYKCVRISEDDLAVELIGRGVKLVGADEMVMADGSRRAASRSDRASATFTQSFTKKYPEIAARNPVYAQLRNLIDMSVAAAYLQKFDVYGRTLWSAETLLSEEQYAIETFTAPQSVEPAVSAVWRGNRLLTPIGGGVTLRPHQALEEANVMADESDDVANAGEAITLPENRWWWD